MSVKLINDRIYRHKVLRVNYTTYNVHRDQDSLNPRTHGDIMVLSGDCYDFFLLFPRLMNLLFENQHEFTSFPLYHRFFLFLASLFTKIHGSFLPFSHRIISMTTQE